MKKIHRSILALVLTFTMLLGTCTSAFAATPRAEASGTEEPGVVTISSGAIENGPIKGVPSDTEGVTVYKGVPFAEPPVGNLRWKAPQDLTATWDEVRVCDAWGNQAMQPDNLNPVGEFWGDEFYFDEDYNPPISEDCLYLNVYAPEHAEGEQLPVMVWIHGGGYDHGHASEMEFNASKLAAKGIIVVCIQYRVNVFGFLALPELSEENNGLSGNYGTMDQIKALEWVNQNIEGFGGDSDNITICGQSAGAMSVTALLSIPLTEGLFNRAIIQSGFGGYAAPGSYAALETKEAACQTAIEKAFGEGTTLEDLRAMDANDFLDAKVYSTLKGAAGSNTLDGYVFTEESVDLTREGALDGIDIMIGGTADEYTSLAGNPNGTMDIEKFHASMEAKYGGLYNRSIYNPKSDKEAYRMNFRSISDGSLAKYRISAEYGKTHNEDHNAYVYYFDHDLAPHDPETVGGRDEDFYGSFHSSELWFMFDSMRDGFEGQRLWTEGDHYLADTMSSYWANFVKTGNPNGEGLPSWEECTSETDGAFMHFKDTEDGTAAVCTTKSDFPARDRLMMKTNMESLGLTEDDLLLPYAIPYGDIPAEVVTEVLDDGQRVVAVNLTYESAVDAGSVSKNDFKVKATLTYGDGKNDIEGFRTITDVTVNGNVVTLKLDPNDEAATTSFYNGTTNVYDISYLVTQKGDIETADGTVKAAKYRSTSVKNLIVDDFQSGSATNTNGKTLNYKYYDPIASAGADENGKYPLVLFLHGSGESGSNNLSQIIANKGAVSWVEPDRVAENPVYVLAPQCPTAREGWINAGNQALVLQMLDEFIAAHPGKIDESRIYIQGLSMGGIGTWKMILDHPEKFAAAIPICGRVPSGSGYNYFTDNGGAAFDALAEFPIWVAHAEDDPTVNISGSREAVAALKAHGNTSVKFYEYLPGAITPNAHHSWKAVYEDQEIYNWLFEQNIARNHNSENPLKAQYTTWEYEGMQAILDYDVDPMWVAVNGDRAILVDTGMGRGGLYDYLKSILPDSVKTIDVLLTHKHGDHIGQIADFKDRNDVEHIYIGAKDADTVIARMGEDADKVIKVNDGDEIPFGNKSITVIDVPGHTTGSVVYLLEDKLFTGDAVGTGYVWMQIGDRSIEEYVDSLQHLNDVIGDRDLTLYGGHTQYRGHMTDQYVRDILECAKGIVDGSIETKQYLRGGVRDARQATYGTASIAYRPDWVQKNSIWADLVTQVQADGQQVIQAAVTYPKELDASAAAMAKRAYQVEARLEAGVASFNQVGMRTISDVQVDGKTVTLTFDRADGLGATSYFDYMAFQTAMYDLFYTIKQTSDLKFADGTTAKATQCTQRSVKNLVVDDFQAASISNGKTTIPYRYYDPVAVNKVDKDGKYPLILFLHGAGESGTNNIAQLIANKGAVAWAEPDRIAENPCYILAPQSKGFSIGGWQGEGVPALLIDMIKKFAAEHPQVDMDRIYIEGMSMGGMGTWNMILTYPDFFAAAIPICGMVNDSVYETDNGAAFDALKNLPIWVAHAENDTTVNVSGSQKAVAALKAHGNTSVKYYEYLEGSITPDPHHSWKAVYADQEIYNWLFEQNKARTDYGKINPKTLYTTWDYGNGGKAILDYDVDPMYVLENGNQAVLIDTGMGQGNLYDYLMGTLKNKDAEISVLLTHKHGDHIGQLKDFVGRDNVKHIYIGEDDAASVLKIMGDEADKVVALKDGDTIPFGDQAFKTITVPGHTLGSVVYLLDGKLFVGDAVGSGYVWMQIGETSIEEYVKSLQHLNDEVAGLELTLYGGHAQYRGDMTDQYVRDILECAKGIVDGSIEGTQYLRGFIRDAKVATYGTASIVYDPARVTDSYPVQLVTKVMDDGQKVIQAVVTYPKAVDPASVTAATYQVQAKQTAANAAFNNIGMRTVTGVQVDGKTVTITLNPADALAGTSYFDGGAFKTFVYELSYQVSQIKEVKLLGGDTVAPDDFQSTSIKNLVVDDFQKATVTNEKGKTIPYRFYDPIKSAKVDANEKYPLVVFLHGAGECGDNNLSHIIANKGAVVWAERVDMNAAYVLAPQCPNMGEGWVNEENEALVMQMLNEFLEAHKDTVDLNRIYIQGLSMGGYGTWKIILDHPEQFAAAMPMCGGVADSYYANNGEAFKAIANMPIWTFHNADDDTVPVENTRKVVAALKAAGSKCIKYEEYTAGAISPSHQVWKYVYSSGTPYNWLFDQTLDRSENHTANPSLHYVHETVEPGVKLVRDYELGQIWVLEQGDKAIVIDTGMGAGDLYEYIINHVLENKNADIDVILTHNHGDHIGCLDDFVGHDQVKNVYVGQGDEVSILRKMGVDAGKVTIVKDGDKIPFGDGAIEVVEVPGHTAGSIVLFYGDAVYTGDAVGSGDLWMQIGVCSIKTYIKSVQHFLDKIGDRKVNLRTGHAEFLEPFTEEYVQQILKCAEGIVDGSIIPTIYMRRDASYATYGRANIVYFPSQINGVDKIELNRAVAAANILDENKYTSASWAALKAAVAAAKLPSDATQAQIDSAAAAVRAAIAGLVEGTPTRDSIVIRYNGKAVSLTVNGEKQSLADKLNCYKIPSAAEELNLVFTPAVEGRTFANIVKDGVALDESAFAADSYKVTISAETAANGLEMAFSFTIVDKQILKTIINAANAAIESGEYDKVVSGVKTLFDNALTKANAVMAQKTASQEAIDEAGWNLLKAVQMLSFEAGNTDALKDLVALAEAMRDSGEYTDLNWQAFLDALAAAKLVAEDPDALKGDVEAASEALLTAIENTLRKANKSSLEAVLTRANETMQNIDQYVPADKAILETAIKSAQAVMDNQYATQKEVNDAALALTNTLTELRVIPNKDYLKAALEATKDIGPDGYTAESYKLLNDKRQEANKIMNDPNASQAQVDNITDELLDAKEKLTKETNSSGGSSHKGGSSSKKTAIGDGTTVVTTMPSNAPAAYVRSDTTLPFTMKRGQAYCFKMTLVNGSNLLPAFTVGNGNVFKTQFVAQIGNDYYFRIWAVGAVGQSTGVYTTLPGQTAQQHCVVSIAA